MSRTQASRSEMSVDVLLVKEGTRFAAADSLSAEDLEKFKDGETVTATIRRPRNVKHHRKLWSLIHAVFPHQNHYATPSDLLTGLKVATGFFDQLQTMEGVPVVIPKSIAFVSLDQNSFEIVYLKMVEVILTRILPGVNKDELNDQVQDILNGRTHGSKEN